MKLKIWLAKYNGTGSTAHIETGDEYDIQVAGGQATSPRKACLAAAKALRDAAARFELLALETEPYHQRTHRRVNTARIAQSAAFEWHDINCAPRNQRILVKSESGEIYAAHWVQNPMTGDEAWCVSEAEDGTQHLVRPVEWREI